MCCQRWWETLSLRAETCWTNTFNTDRRHKTFREFRKKNKLQEIKSYFTIYELGNTMLLFTDCVLHSQETCSLVKGFIQLTLNGSDKRIHIKYNKLTRLVFLLHQRHHWPGVQVSAQLCCWSLQAWINRSTNYFCYALPVTEGWGIKPKFVGSFHDWHLSAPPLPLTLLCSSYCNSFLRV